MKKPLSIPGFEDIGSPTGLPPGTPTGGLVTGQNIVIAFLDLTLIAAILLCLYFILKGGLDIVQSKGQKEALNRGRERVLYSLFGLAMIFLSFLMISALSAFFGFNLLSFPFSK